MQDHELYWISLLALIIAMFVLMIIQDKYKVKGFIKTIINIIWIIFSMLLFLLISFWIMSSTSTSSTQESNDINYEDLD